MVGASRLRGADVLDSEVRRPRRISDGFGAADPEPRPAKQVPKLRFGQRAATKTLRWLDSIADGPSIEDAHQAPDSRQTVQRPEVQVHHDESAPRPQNPV